MCAIWLWRVAISLPIRKWCILSIWLWNYGVFWCLSDNFYRWVVSRLNLEGNWLSVTPDVNQIKLDEDAEFIIIGSDGLWDSFKRYASDEEIGVGSSSKWGFWHLPFNSFSSHPKCNHSDSLVHSLEFLWLLSVASWPYRTSFKSILIDLDLCALVCSNDAVQFIRKQLKSHGDVQVRTVDIAFVLPWTLPLYEWY